MKDTDGDGFGDKVINVNNNSGRPDFVNVAKTSLMNINLVLMNLNNLQDSKLKL